MEAVIEAMRQALADDATPEQRTAAAQLLRSVLAKLEPAPTSAPTDPVGQLLTAITARVRNAKPKSMTRSPRVVVGPQRPVPFVPWHTRRANEDVRRERKGSR